MKEAGKFITLGDNILKELKPKKLPKQTAFRLGKPRRSRTTRYYKRNITKMRKRSSY